MCSRFFPFRLRVFTMKRMSRRISMEKETAFVGMAVFVAVGTVIKWLLVIFVAAS